MRTSSLAPFLLGAIAVVANTAAPWDRNVADTGEEDEADEVRSAHVWQRKRGAVPEGAQRASVLAFRELPKVLDGAPPSSLQPWKPLGPAPLFQNPGGQPNVGNSAGRATAVAVHPTDPAIAYVGFAGGGVWKTTDGGATWSVLTDGLSSLAIGSVAIDPTAPDTIYVGTGEGNYSGDNYAGHGVFKSTDGGATWTQPAGDALSGVAITKIVVDPDQGALYASVVTAGAFTGDYCDNVTIATTKLGLFKSMDGGGTWTQLVKGQAIADFLLDTSKSPRELLLSRVSAGLERYTDGDPNGTVAIKDTPWDSTKVARVGLTRVGPGLGVIYAAFGGTKAALGVYRSMDGGGTWTLLPGTPDWCKTQCYYDTIVAASPTDPDNVILGGSQCALWRTTTGTSATPIWTSPPLPGGVCAPDQNNWFDGAVHPDVHAVAFAPSDPTRVWVASDGGVAISKTSGASWKQQDTGIATLEFYGLCVDPGNPEIVLGGMQDNGYARRGADALTWQALSAGDGGHCVIDPAQPGTAINTTQQGAVFRRTMGYQQSQKVFDATPGQCNNYPGCGDRTAWEVPLAMDPTATANVYVGTHRLWHSPAFGKGGTWAAISPDLTGGKGAEKCLSGGTVDDVLTAITVAPTSSSTIFVGSASGVVQVTPDGGGSWSNLTAAPLPRRWVAGIAVDPASADVVDIAFSGFTKSTPKTPGHVFHSDDGGKTFVLRDIPIDASVNHILAHPVASGLLYLATDAGVLATNDGGVTWVPLGTGLPAAPVTTLAFHAAATRLVAGTYGRSAWSVAFTPKLGVVAPQSLELTATLGDTTFPTGDVTIANDETLGSVLEVDVASDAPWIGLDAGHLRVAGSKPGHVGVTTSLAGKGVGTYDGTITIKSADATAKVPVHLTVTMPPVEGTGGGAGAGGGAGTGGTGAAAGSAGKAGVSGGAGAASALAPAPSPPADSGGCGCRTVETRESSSVLAAASLALVAALRRRIRTRRAPTAQRQQA